MLGNPVYHPLHCPLDNTDTITSHRSFWRNCHWEVHSLFPIEELWHPHHRCRRRCTSSRRTWDTCPEEDSRALWRGHPPSGWLPQPSEARLYRVQRRGTEKETEQHRPPCGMAGDVLGRVHPLDQRREDLHPGHAPADRRWVIQMGGEDCYSVLVRTTLFTAYHAPHPVTARLSYNSKGS